MHFTQQLTTQTLSAPELFSIWIQVQWTKKIP